MNLLKNALAALALAPLTLLAQDRYMTRTGHVEFHSSTPIEDIHADNDKVVSVWDAGTGALEISMLIKAFTFKKALMQEHFNENYMESGKFPKSNFKGSIKAPPPRNSRWRAPIRSPWRARSPSTAWRSR